MRRTAQGLENAVASGAIDAATAENADADADDISARLKDAGQVVATGITQPILRAAQVYRSSATTSNLVMSILVVLAAIAAVGISVFQTNKDFRARNVVEQGVLALLIAAASVAILTTIGIVLSLIFNTIEFFKLYPASEFFTLLEWAPSFSGRGGASSLGILPLLWGTCLLYTSPSPRDLSTSRMPSSA